MGSPKNQNVHHKVFKILNDEIVIILKASSLFILSLHDSCMCTHCDVMSPHPLSDFLGHHWL